jgi:EGF-like domain
MRGSILAFAATFGLAAAGCPSGCTKNGVCSQNDLCTCNPGLTGADCSLRMCLFGAAWATDAANPHEHVECSNQGACNRATGECECHPGFTGRACSRSECTRCGSFLVAASVKLPHLCYCSRPVQWRARTVALATASARS